jgi:hypothetical protein
MSIKEKFIPVIESLVAHEFQATEEGTTSSGRHERDVANFFAASGFPMIKNIVTIPRIITRGPRKGMTLYDEYLIMNRGNHEPRALDLPHADGYYTILQPYSKGERGAMVPAPDIFLVRIINRRITEWLGIECKSSKDSLRPMWNEHLPRPFVKGNILYFFSGFDEVSKKKMNTLFTSEIFFNGKEFNENAFWDKIRDFMTETWNTTYATEFPIVECNLRQFCGQRPFTPVEMREMVSKTVAFLKPDITDVLAGLTL